MLSDRRQAQNALEGLGAEIGTQLAFDENGVLTLEFADDVTCSIEQPADSNRVFFSAAVFRVPSVDRERVLVDALALNLFRLSPPGSALAYDRESEEMVLCYSAQCQTLAADTLSETLVAIATEVRRLRAGVHDTAKSAPAQPASDFDFASVIRV